MSPNRWISLHVLAGALAALVALPAPGIAAPAAPNLLINPDFEASLHPDSWMPSGWDTSRAGLPSVFFGRDTFSVHGGHYAVSVANASEFLMMAHNWSQSLIVGPEAWGKDAVFSVWTKSVGVEGRAYIKVDAYQDTLSKMAKTWGVTRDEASQRLNILAINESTIDLAWKRQFFSDTETEWVRREVRVFIPPTVNMIFVRCGLLGIGQLIVDDASLTLEPALPAPPVIARTNLLVDPGFEGDGNDWEYSLPPYPDMKADRDTLVKHAGKASLRLSSGPVAMVPGPAGTCQVLCNRNLAGKHLRFTGFIKSDSLVQSSAYLKLICKTPHGVEQAVSHNIIAGTMDWTRCVAEIDAPLDTYSVWIWFQYIAPTRGRVWFDDGSLEVTTPTARRTP